ncbi:MAG: PASTA domain-containing protein [Ignavibacteriales bacterium]|nr:PASTA domain-containing protein [Ignavibacteriales bacterium]
MVFPDSVKSKPERGTHLPDQPSGRGFSGRVFTLKLFLMVSFLVVAGRLVEIQILHAPEYQSIAKKQYEQRFTLPAVRGNIYDRNGNVLASNTMYVSFAADPKIVADRDDAIAEKFSRIFGRPKLHYLAKFRGAEPSRRFIWLERRVSPEIARKVEAAKFEGVVVINEPKRLYHYDDLAGVLIGFTDIDSRGISGIELQHDSDLLGIAGAVTMQRDGLGRTRPSADYPYIAPVNGHHLVLTINLAYQAIVEEELKRGVALNKADGGLAIMLNPKTGEILALATSPAVNPNESATYGPGAAKNRIITDMFEPGSVFKIVTAGAAYDHDILSPGKRFNTEGGEYKIRLRSGGVRLIRDTHEHDVLTFQEGIELSSNIVMAKAVEQIGAERFYRQARDFGFGIPTGVDLPGEVRGRLKKPHEWSGTSLQAMAYGYEVAVTPLQIATAYAAIANNGVLMKPFVVARVVNERGDVISEQQPQKIRTVVSVKTARLLTQAFEGAVERGTALEVRLNGLRIAGKTGTAKRIVDGRYAPGSYTSSFVGYFPAEDPQIVCLVMMDNPRARGYYGGATSGPVFRAITQRVIHTSAKFSKPPDAEPRDRGIIAVPDVRNVRTVIASKILHGLQLSSQVFGEGDVVIRQSPPPGARVEKGDVVKLVLNNDIGTDRQGRMVVPDLRGMSMRRAMNRLVAEEFEVEFEGSGVVSRQLPRPGERVPPGTRIRVVCEPRGTAPAALY